jgi:hypothetical protein
MVYDKQYKYRYRNNAENIGKIAHPKISIHLITRIFFPLLQQLSWSPLNYQRKIVLVVGIITVYGA